jgi:hypothetical protein
MKNKRIEELQKEIETAKEIAKKALNKYLASNKKADYNFYKQNYAYLLGLERARAIIEKGVN